MREHAVHRDAKGGPVATGSPIQQAQALAAADRFEEVCSEAAKGFRSVCATGVLASESPEGESSRLYSDALVRLYEVVPQSKVKQASDDPAPDQDVLGFEVLDNHLAGLLYNIADVLRNEPASDSTVFTIRNYSKDVDDYCSKAPPLDLPPGDRWDRDMDWRLSRPLSVDLSCLAYILSGAGSSMLAYQLVDYTLTPRDLASVPPNIAAKRQAQATDLLDQLRTLVPAIR